MPIPLPRILCDVPQTLHARLEIAKAIETLAAQEEEARLLSTPIDAGAERLDPELIKHCAHVISQEFLSLVRSNLGGRRAAKAAVDDPKHPGWPAHTPDGKGGEFRPKDSALGSPITIAPTPVEDRQNTNGNDVQLAMGPTDPVTGVPLFLETPANRFGGGEGGGGGFGERSSAGSSEAAAADAQGAGPPQIGSFPVPESLTFGTTLFGNYAHQEIADLLPDLYPGVPFELRVLPGQRGIDVTVPDKFVSQVGFVFGEIKPLTPSGEAAFNRQLEQWGVGPVQAITYDAAGNVYYGFR